MEGLEIYENAWIYNGEPFYPEFHKEIFGFVYIIENIIDGRKYIGQKRIKSSKQIQRSGKKIKIKVESNWRDYFGSSKDLTADVLEFGKDNFKRNILYLCKSIPEMNYLESREIFMRDALINPEYYNRFVLCRINSNSISSLKYPLGLAQSL